MDTSATAPTPLSADSDTLEILENVASALDPFNNQTADALNEGCFCITLNRDALRGALASTVGAPDLFAMIEQHCPYVFAAHPVFISDAHVRQIRQLVEAVESVVALPAYRTAVLAGAPDIARHDPGGARGVFFGYDFHLHAQGVSLIEINTNAGGAMLNAALAKAQRACCAPVEAAMPALDAAGLESSIVAMFRAEWAQSGRTQPLRTIAIVDDDPMQQYLYPEFLLFQQLFERHGLQAVIADPRELTLCGGVLWHEQTPIDLVYNRLTDFMLSEPACAALRAAYLDRSVVLTPHPQAHALYADKRNLAILTDPQRLIDFGVPQATQEILLASIPRTEVVDAAHADRLWAGRRRMQGKLRRTGQGHRDIKQAVGRAVVGLDTLHQKFNRVFFSSEGL